MFTVLISILSTTISQFFSLFGIILVVGFLLGFLERQSVKYLYKTFGKSGYLITAWIGTPVHELGHVFMCIIFRHRIVEVQWFPIRSEVSYLGYVLHSYSQKSIYQRIGNFFIGIGPFFSGILSLLILMYYFVPDSYSFFTEYLKLHVQPGNISKDMIANMFIASEELIKNLFTVNHMLKLSFWLFLILAICISTHIALSKEDINGAASGALTILILLYIINSLEVLFHFNSNKWIAIIASLNVYTLAFLSLAILFSCITFVLCFFLYVIKNIGKERSIYFLTQKFPLIIKKVFLK